MQKKPNPLSGLWLILFLLGQTFHLRAQKQTPLPYQSPKLSPEARAKDLLSRMTPEEKIGQMTQLCASSITLDGTKNLDLNLDKIRAFILQDHVGSFLSGTGSASRWVDFVEGIQKVAVQETRLGIPVLFGMDNVHGSNYTDGATILPHNLNMGNTFNVGLMTEAGKITAIESADLGHIWNFAPVLDVGKNPFWPRLYETFGEDPLVCGRMGSAFIRSFQNCPEVKPYQLAACAKHFIGYSDPKSGWDRTPSEIPDQTLHEIFVPPFRMAFDAGVKTLMVNSGELNGEPVHASRTILTDLLRKKLGFRGVVLTDIKDILKMVEMHGAYASEEQATLASIEAGIDMYMACNSTNFCRIMKKALSENRISIGRIDSSVYRILVLKFELGLFENPYPSRKRLASIGSEAHYQKAVQAARESMVLLRNEGKVLPLGPGVRSALVAGMASNSKRMMNGAWTLEWMGAEEKRQPPQTKTLLESLTKGIPGIRWDWVDSIGFDQAPVGPGSARFRVEWEKKARLADLLILTVGEQPYSEFKGNIQDLSLSVAQSDWIREAEKLGKPMVLLVFSGRPRILPEIKTVPHAVVYAGHPGVGGAEALADILSGRYDPSGKLSFTYPATQGHAIPYYHKKSERYLPAYPFGHGLRYQPLEYQKLTLISDSVLSRDSRVEAEVEIRNPAATEKDEAVLVYQTDETGRITRPVRQLIDFQKIRLLPGESKKIRFSFSARDLCSFPDAGGQVVSEPGFHQIEIGEKRLRFRIK